MESLWLASNQLVNLPSEMKALVNLKEIYLFNNPLKNPSFDIVSRGIPHILRDCRERFKTEQLGRKPPPMSVLRVGKRNFLTISSWQMYACSSLSFVKTYILITALKTHIHIYPCRHWKRGIYA